MQCVQMIESADPYTWKDNYLCYQIRETTPPTPPPTYNLSVNDITLNINSRDKLWTDGSFDLSITMVNQGNNLPSNPAVAYYLDDVLLATHTINAGDLTNGAYRSDALPDIPSPLVAGDYTAKICIDSSNVISETDETDNCQSIKVEVQKPINPAVMMQLFK
jgi:subtilase family serine protease